MTLWENNGESIVLSEHPNKGGLNNKLEDSDNLNNLSLN